MAEWEEEKHPRAKDGKFGAGGGVGGQAAKAALAGGKKKRGISRFAERRAAMDKPAGANTMARFGGGAAEAEHAVAVSKLGGQSAKQEGYLVKQYMDAKAAAKVPEPKAATPYKPIGSSVYEKQQGGLKNGGLARHGYLQEVRASDVGFHKRGDEESSGAVAKAPGLNTLAQQAAAKSLGLNNPQAGFHGQGFDRAERAPSSWRDREKAREGIAHRAEIGPRNQREAAERYVGHPVGENTFARYQAGSLLNDKLAVDAKAQRGAADKAAFGGWHGPDADKLNARERELAKANPNSSNVHVGADAPAKPKVPRAPGPKALLPKMTDEEKADPITKALYEGKEVAAKNLGGGVNASVKLTVQGADGKQVVGVFKPSKGEVDVGYGTAIPRLFVNEVAMSKIAPMFGVEAGATAYRLRGKDIGSFKAWSEGESSDALPYGQVKFDRQSIENMRAMDIVSGNCDRHGGNVVWREGSEGWKAIAIDHGYAFPNRPVSHQWFGYVLGDHGNPAQFEEGGKITPKTRELISNFNEDKFADKLLRSGISPKSTEEAVHRLRYLKSNPELAGVSVRAGYYGGAKEIDVDSTNRSLVRAQKVYGDSVNPGARSEVHEKVMRMADQVTDKAIHKLWEPPKKAPKKPRNDGW